ncbi:AAA family ATPase [Thalassobellus suaedae]|uniref:AAA family ATPase n=1 Tax=Thalassobellus suaedae TaxID=3074124 RepID=A0ABY9Y1U7_9FLAO|nr:AAA family ATPase [Flavobacteriaceae bacterium HL-DH10]
MEINFQGKYKSITSFNWTEIPNFVVITGPNGTGKSQLLDLIHNTIINKNRTTERVSIIGKSIKPNEVTFLKGEWQLQNTSHVNLSNIQQQMDAHYNNFKGGNYRQIQPNQIHIFSACQEIIRKTGKQFNQISKEEFYENFPEILIEQESQLSQKIGEVFYNYRLSEIELLANKKKEENIKLEIGEKPWVVLREIIRESKLPFEINDPSTNGFRDGFQLKLTHQILNEEVNFNDLSSGEKVLISLVFYLYNSQEKKLFPKLLLLDEPDAHLHPSMSQQFLNVVKNVLVDKFGVQVIMTTHSPSTVMLAPNDSVFEMSRVEPRIAKSPSKNHSVSLLTAGLVYVGEGTKYFLVEDSDDVSFYSFVYNQLTLENIINADIPLVFISASTKDKSGGKDAVQNWVTKLQESGIVNIIHGLIDADSGNITSDGVYKIDRYSIENYLTDPIIVYAALIDKEVNPIIDDVNFSVGEEYKLKSLSAEILQKVADSIISDIEPDLVNIFTDFNQNTETERIEIEYSNGIKLSYPKWLFTRRGKTILNEAYNRKYTSRVINFTTLFKALRKLNLFPKDLIDKLNEIKNGC